jgi:magnesium transporter
VISGLGHKGEGVNQKRKSRTQESHKTGLPPGSLVHVGDLLIENTCISVIDYNKDTVAEKNLSSIDELSSLRGTDTVSLVTIEGLANVEVVEKVGELFGIHQLVLEDILYEDYLYIVLKGMVSVGKQFKIDYEQISLLVLDKLVIVFKERKDDLIAPVIQRIRTSKGRFRSLGADFLAYSILDAIIDQNFVLIDSLDEAITVLEDELLAGDPSKTLLNRIQRLKREIINIRRYVSPIRELINEMLRSESPLIEEKTHIYLKDVSDHAIRIVESIELHRDIISGLLEIYISSISNKMNEVMKVLTIFASIFIPLTFLTGIYGMNFEHMPELKLPWTYPALWVVFLVVPTVLLTYFWRKKWL